MHGPRRGRMERDGHRCVTRTPGGRVNRATAPSSRRSERVVKCGARLHVLAAANGRLSWHTQINWIIAAKNWGWARGRLERERIWGNFSTPSTSPSFSNVLPKLPSFFSRATIPTPDLAGPCVVWDWVPTRGGPVSRTQRPAEFSPSYLPRSASTSTFARVRGALGDHGYGRSTYIHA